MGKYIVMFKEGTPKDVIDKAEKDVTSSGGTIGHRYTTTMLGFSAEIPDSVISPLAANAHIDAIEADGPVSAYAKTLGIK